MLIDQLYVFSREMSIQSFIHFLIMSSVCCSVVGIPYIFWILTPYQIRDLQIISPLHGLFLTLLLVSFDAQKFFCFCFTYIYLFGSVRSLCPAAYGILVPRLGIRTYIPCIARQILNQWITRGIPKSFWFWCSPAYLCFTCCLCFWRYALSFTEAGLPLGSCEVKGYLWA